MTMTDSPPVTIFRFKVLCTGKRKDGSICNEVLCRTSLETGERQMVEGKIEMKCPRCGAIAEFR